MPRPIAVGQVAAATGLTAGVVVFALESDQGSPGRRLSSALLHGLEVGVPTAVGLLVLARRPDDRFARLLLASGLAWSALALTDASSPVAYSIGRVAYWLVELSLVFLLLGFPSGRLAGAAERATFRALTAIVALLFLPTALLVSGYPLPFPGATCGVHCPANGLALTDSTPALVDDVVIPLREVLVTALFVGVAAILVTRARSAGPLLRRALVPVAALALLRVVSFATYLVARAADRTSTAADVAGWIFLLSLPLVAAGFGAGLLARRLYGTVAVARLARRLEANPTLREIEAALADVLEDPTLEIVYRQPEEGRWIDATGWPVAAPAPTAEQEVTELRGDGALVGAIVHASALAQDPGVMETAASFTVMALKNGELVEHLQASLEDLAESRARVVAVADATRRRIEHDLHDGAQQRLIALRLRLAAQSRRLEASDRQAASELAALGDAAEEAVDEVRELARGIYPSLLADRGLAEALAAVAHAASIATTLDADGIGRYRPEIESAVYFACVEAVQNAAKHARGAQSIAIALTVDSRLHFRVADDGQGGWASDGALTSLRDRIRAVGGDVAVESPPDEGTRVLGSVPVS